MTSFVTVERLMLSGRVIWFSVGYMGISYAGSCLGGSLRASRGGAPARAAFWNTWALINRYCSATTKHQPPRTRLDAFAVARDGLAELAQKGG